MIFILLFIYKQYAFGCYDFIYIKWGPVSQVFTKKNQDIIHFFMKNKKNAFVLCKKCNSRSPRLYLLFFCCCLIEVGRANSFLARMGHSFSPKNYVFILVIFLFSGSSRVIVTSPLDITMTAPTNFSIQQWEQSL